MKSILLFTFAMAIVLTPACRKDKVKGCMLAEAINYSDKATEDDGSCQFARDKFLGSWAGKKLCTSDPLDSTISIQVVPGLGSFSDMNITNFPVDGISITATVNSSDLNKLIIPDQEINNDLDVFNISGEGQVYESDFVINYFIRRTSGGSIDTCGLGLIKNP